MIPILTTDQMRDADAAAVAARGTEALVAAAGTAVGLEAQRMLGRCYGRRVAVVVGPGLNGADGRVAARWLVDRGAKVDVIDVASQPEVIDAYDVYIDAAYGLGCSRPYVAPRVGARTAVLAVDLPSGVDADTGAVLGRPVWADVTLAIGALKYAHVDGPAHEHCGEVHYAGLGIASSGEDGLVEDSDLSTFVRRSSDDHKWVHAIQVFAGSTSMPGAAELCVRGALAGGASMVRLTSRGEVAPLVHLPPEVVHAPDGRVDPRCSAIVAGPGLGRDADDWLAERLRDIDVPVVLDADALHPRLVESRTDRDATWVLTPHEGEFARLHDAPVGASRISAARDLARATRSVVLLKGPTTVVASPDGSVRVVQSGTAQLATAGSGDVLSGMIGAAIARGHEPLVAAALSAHVHGRAGSALGAYPSAGALCDAVGRLLDAADLGHR